MSTADNKRVTFDAAYTKVGDVEDEGPDEIDQAFKEVEGALNGHEQRIAQLEAQIRMLMQQLANVANGGGQQQPQQQHQMHFIMPPAPQQPGMQDLIRPAPKQAFACLG